MLARALADSEEVKKYIEKIGQEFFIEYKYDGERVQIHYNRASEADSRVTLFSRNLEKSDKKYKAILAPLENCLNAVEDLSSCILDGEIVPYSFQDQKILPFTDILKMEKSGSAAIENRTKVYLFDILMFNGDLKLDSDIENRKNLVSEIVKKTQNLAPEDSVLDSVITIRANTNTPDFSEQLIQEWNSAKQQGYEGVMIKPIGPKSTYIANSRSLWIKLKRQSDEYGAADNLDLVVMGVYNGKGKRKEVYGSFLLGVYDQEMDEYWPVTKLGTGFSEEDLAGFKKQFYADLTAFPLPEYKGCGRLKPDAWLFPRFVWEIKYDSLSLSPIYEVGRGVVDEGKGVSVRFGRFVRKREDKAVRDACSRQDLIKLKLKQDDVTFD